MKIELLSNDIFVISNIDRMPVILGDQESSDTWLNGFSSSKFNTVLKPYENSDLVRVSSVQEMRSITFLLNVHKHKVYFYWMLKLSIFRFGTQ